MAKYAEKTKVPIEKTRDEIQKELVRFGVTQYGFGVSPRGTGIIFKWKERVYRLNVNEPNRNSFQYDSDFERAMRCRWRILLLCIKAKLNAVEDGLSDFEDEFLGYMALPDGGTVGDWLKLPENVNRLASAKMPLLLMSAEKSGD